MTRQQSRTVVKGRQRSLVAKLWRCLTSAGTAGTNGWKRQESDGLAVRLCVTVALLFSSTSIFFSSPSLLFFFYFFFFIFLISFARLHVPLPLRMNYCTINTFHHHALATRVTLFKIQWL